jgi:hypothetical protein
MGLSSCSDSSYDPSVVVNYVSLKLNGDAFVVVPVGTAYEEEGVEATIAGEDVSSSVTIDSGNLDTNKVGMYTITYSATNKEGFTSTLTRTVAVCDPSITTDISGKYVTQEGSYRLLPDADGSYEFEGSTWIKGDFSGFNVTIEKKAPGIFYVSDIMGGYYDQGRGYGDKYAMKGYFQLFADNHIECLSGDVAGFGDSFTSFQDGLFDTTTKAISYRLGYTSGMYFFITLL